MTVGRFQPFTKGHLNMVIEGEAPCIVYQIKPAGLPEKLKGLKVGSRTVKKEDINIVLNYIGGDNNVDLDKCQKELLKRPFTNELIAKELDIVKMNTPEIMDIVYVTNMFEAVAKFNKFILDNQDKYEPQYWMCGDDRIDEYQKTLDKYIASGEPLAIERNGEKFENVITSLKLNTGKGRTNGVSGTDVRKAILNKDKASFEKLMPKGTGVMFDEFVESFEMFKDKLQMLIKESQMMSLKDYVSLNDKLLSLDNYIYENLSHIEFINEKLKIRKSNFYKNNSLLDVDINSLDELATVIESFFKPQNKYIIKISKSRKSKWKCFEKSTIGVLIDNGYNIYFISKYDNQTILKNLRIGDYNGKIVIQLLVRNYKGKLIECPLLGYNSSIFNYGDNFYDWLLDIKRKMEDNKLGKEINLMTFFGLIE